MIHALISLVIGLLGAFLGHIEPAVYMAGFYLGREIAQAEYRYIEAYCDRKRENMSWWAVVSPKAWTLKGMLDWLLPTLVAAIIICIFKFM